MSDCSNEMLPPMVTRSYGLLSRLPLLFTASSNSDQARMLALGYLKTELRAEAATLFLLEPSQKMLRLWVIDGGRPELETSVIPVDQGIVGWVVARQEAVLVNDVQSDPRYFAEVDRRSKYETRTMLCAPLSGAGSERIGAIQVLNRIDGTFSTEDLELLQCLAPQFVLGLQNSLLREKWVEAQSKLEALQRKRDDMLAVLSHELRTPLGIVQAAGDLVSRGKLDADLQRRTLERMLDGLQRLTRTVSQIRNAAALRGSKVSIDRKPVSISTVCSTIYEQLSEAARQVRGIIFSQEIPADLIALGDDALLSVAFNNLLHNAIRFTPDGGTVTVRVRREMGVIVIEVSDSGIGIPENQRGAIFEKFYEVGSTLSHSSGSLGFRSGGLGLGLATAKAILEAHEASLELDSKEGVGTTFRVRLQGV